MCFGGGGAPAVVQPDPQAQVDKTNDEARVKAKTASRARRSANLLLATSSDSLGAAPPGPGTKGELGA